MQVGAKTRWTPLSRENVKTRMLDVISFFDVKLFADLELNVDEFTTKNTLI